MKHKFIQLIEVLNMNVGEKHSTKEWTYKVFDTQDVWNSDKGIVSQYLSLLSMMGFVEKTPIDKNANLFKVLSTIPVVSPVYVPDEKMVEL